MIGLLSFILITLVVGTGVTFLAGRWARWAALLSSVVFLLEVAYLFHTFSWVAPPATASAPEFSNSESYAWIHLGWLTVNYTVGVDGISLVLILLTAFLQIATVVYSWNEDRRPAAWFGLLLLTCLGCLGVFVALDIL